jgi:tetratricopeptide (TPR) repeat protein
MIRSVDRPYPGTRPFRSAESGRFFGRRAEAAELAELWRANRLVIAAGRAGTGKTSLLRAGILPLVKGGRADVLPPGMLSNGSTFPDAALPEHNPYTLALLRSWSPGEDATRLVGLTVREFVRRRAEGRGRVVLAVIDQAEELSVDAGPRRAYGRRLLDELAEALKEEPRLHILLMVREPALDTFSDALRGVPFHVPPLSHERAVEAVTGPVEGTGRSFAPGAAEELVEDLLTCHIQTTGGGERSVRLDHIEPALLQVVCEHLWDSLPADAGIISARDVRRYGDADTALAAHCGCVIAATADDHALRAGPLRSWLTRTFVTELGTRDTAYQGMTDTAGMPNAVARALEDARLLAAERRSGTRWYELLSDRLIEPLRHAADEQSPPVQPAEYLGRAGRALALGDLDRAEHYAEETLRTAPATDLRLRAEATSLLGNLAHERGKPAEAKEHYRAAARLFEAVRDTPAVAFQLAAVARTLLDQERVADAVEELHAAVARLPHDSVVQTALGWALWELGQSEGAVAVLTGVLALNAGNPDALQARGEILADLGDARDALRDLDRAVRPDRPSARAARGLAHAELGDKTASREIESALDDAPRNGPVLFYAARAESLGGNESAALDYARRALNATDPALPAHQRAAALKLVGQNPDDRR